MARSFYTPSPDQVIEDFEDNHYYHEPSDRHYEMYWRGDDLFQSRYQLDEEGQRMNEIEVRVDAIVGSGNHVRTYLYRTPSHELFQMPLAWYSQERKWRMNPGYDNPQHRGFTRNVTRNCMFCHNAYPEVPKGSDTAWQPHLFPSQLPHGIGCQRCHGPGQAHIELAESGEASDGQLLASIVNPSRLEPKLRDDVCYQCHLQPSSSFLSTVLRFGRPEYAYRPGQPLGDYLVHADFDEPDGRSRFEINHHPYRLRQSRCFTESDGGLSCLSCHDPHRKLAPVERPAHYRQACLSCHEIAQCSTATRQEAAVTPDGQPVLADCVSCHMPSRRTEDVIHAVMTDHRIVARVGDPEDLLAPRDEPQDAPRTESPHAYWAHHDESHDDIQMHLAVAAADSGGPIQLNRLAEMVNRSRPSELDPLAQLATSQMEAHDFIGAAGTISQILALSPEHARAHLEMGMALDALGDTYQSQEYYARSLELGPPLPEARLGLGNALFRQGELAAAEEQIREAIRLRPIYPDALFNLGLVLMDQQRWQDAAQAFQGTLGADPNSIDAYAYLGLAQLRAQNTEAALQTFARGAFRAPGNPQLCEGQAASLLLAGQPAEALDEVARGHGLQADEASLLIVTALAERQLGRHQTATAAWQQAQRLLHPTRGASPICELLLEHAADSFPSR